MTLDIPHLRKVIAAATPGPWSSGPDKHLAPCVGHPRTNALIAGNISWDMGRSPKEAIANASYIAIFSPSVTTAILDALEAAKARAEAADRMMKAVRNELEEAISCFLSGDQSIRAESIEHVHLAVDALDGEEG